MGAAGGRTDTPGRALPPRLGFAPARGFVGRDAERVQLRSAIAAATAGAGPRLVLVAGEPGSGKTTLLAQVAREAHDGGCTVVYGRGEEGLEVPYGLWREALGRAAWPTGLTQLEELFDAVLDHLAAAAATSPLVLIVDDLQWADQASLRLLSHVIGARPTARLALLASYRSTEVAAGGALARWLASAGRDPAADGLPLPALTPEEVAQLVPDDGDDRRQVAEDIWSRSAGNAFFVTALLDEHDHAGGGLGSFTLEQVVDDRVARLGAHADAVLRAAAVVGETFDVGVVAAASGVDASAVLSTLEQAVRHRLVTETADGAAFTFVHALVADALRAGVTATRRRQLHRAAADALRAAGAPAAAVAAHLASADPDDRAGREAAVDAALETGCTALVELAYDDAVTGLQHVVDLIAGWGLDDDRRCSALVALARARRRAGDADSAAGVVIDAVDLAARLGRWDDVVRAAACFPAIPTATPSRAVVARLERAATAIPHEHPARAAVLRQLVASLRYSDPERAYALAEEAMVCAERSGDRVARVYALDGLGASRLSHPDPSVPLEIALSMIDLVATADDDITQEVAYVAGVEAIFCLMRAGDLRAVDEQLQNLRALDDRLHRVDGRWSVLNTQAMRAVLEGRLDLAAELGATATEVPTVYGARTTLFCYVGRQAIIALLRGEFGTFADTVATLMSQFPHPGLEAAYIGTLVAADRRTEARERLRALAEDGFAGLTCDDLGPGAAVLLADACRQLEAEAEAPVLYERLLPYSGQCAVIAVVSVVCLGAIDHALGQLAIVCGRDDVARRHLEDAARLNARIGARPFLALTRVEQAVLGVPGAAEEARAIADELGLGLVHQRLDALVHSEPADEVAGLLTEGDGEVRRPRRSILPFPARGPAVRIRCLGGFQLTIEGEDVDLGSVRPRARSVLRLLAVQGGAPVHRERIADALWPDSRPDAAQRSLQVAVSSLRGAVAAAHGPGRPALIVRDGDAYMLAVDAAVDVDVVRFRDAVSAAEAERHAGKHESAIRSFEAALSCYSGELLPEEGPADWIVEEREHLRIAAARSAASLGELLLREGDTKGARDAAERGLAIDRYHDPLWHLLIAAHTARGDDAAAQRASERYTEVLADLGLPVADRQSSAGNSSRW